MIKFLYGKFLKPILFLFDPELIHNSFIFFGELLGRNILGQKLMSFMYGYKGKDISKTVDGLKYKTPILLSAGFDYNGRLTQILPFLSFGGEEVGSVTAKYCPGNKKPRLGRLKKNKSILVNKGLKNDGVEKIIERLKKRKRYDGYVIGVSIAMTNISSISTIDAAVNDYHYSLKRLVEENIGDYYTLNISCPNSYWGENFATPDNLKVLLKKLSEITHSKPVYVKMPINLEWEEFDKLIEIIISYKLNGVIIGNLNKNRNDLVYPQELKPNQKGNLSGRPTFKRSNELIRRTKEKYGEKLTIIGCGGIFTAHDAIEKFKAGSDLVQLITGMIFEGPQLIKEIAKEYSCL